MAGGTFLGLAAAMKSRFTAATVPVTTAEVISTPLGLYRPVAGAKAKECTDELPSNDVKNYTKISKTHLLFYPELLVCKRLGVKPPVHSSNRPLEMKKHAESTFFEQEVMKRAAVAEPAESKTEQLRNDHDIEPNVLYQRPGMDVYKAIYEPQSASEDDDNNDTARESESEEIDVSNEQNAIVSARTTDIVPAVKTNDTRKGDDNSDKESRRKKRKRKDREERKRRGKRTRSPTSSSAESNLDESSSDDEERRKLRKRRRKRKDEKKKKKKHKSSRRYDD